MTVDHTGSTLLQLHPGSQRRRSHAADRICAYDACNSLDYDRAGPHHCCRFGLSAANVDGFEYSKAMKNSKLTSNSETPDRFIADPLNTAPGTMMGHAGIPDGQERADLLACLRASNDGRRSGR